MTPGNSSRELPAQRSTSRSRGHDRGSPDATWGRLLPGGKACSFPLGLALCWPLATVTSVFPHPQATGGLGRNHFLPIWCRKRRGEMQCDQMSHSHLVAVETKPRTLFLPQAPAWLLGLPRVPVQVPVRGASLGPSLGPG